MCEDLAAITLEIGGARGKPARARAQAHLADLDIGDRTDRYPDQLSGGQQQRVAIARSMRSTCSTP